MLKDRVSSTHIILAENLWQINDAKKNIGRQFKWMFLAVLSAT